MNMNKYERKEVFNKTKEYFNGDELATNVWINKYALKDSEGNLYELTPYDMHKRIASELKRIEDKYENPMSEDDIFKTIENFKYIVPQGSPMAGIGNNFQVSSLSNCYVVGPQKNNDGQYEDSYGSVLRTDQEIIQLCKRRAGVGTTLEHIRPNGSGVKNAALTSTGVIPFMERFSNSIREVAQCLYYNTKVLTINGLVEIKDINKNDFVWTENGWVQVINKLKNKKDTIKVKTKFGNELICSEDHIFHTLKGEKKIKDINIGEKISMINGVNFEQNSKYLPLNKPIMENRGNRLEELKVPEFLTEDLAYFLGYMYGDGSIYKIISKQTNNHIGTEISLACDSNRTNIIFKLDRIFKDLFSKNLKHKETNGNWIVLRISSQFLHDFLHLNKIAKEKSENIEFPEIIKKSNKDVQMSFISGYFDADGSYSKSKKIYKFSSISKQFLLDIKLILQSYGILTKIHKEDRSEKGWKDIYTLTIPGSYSKNIFYELMKESCKVYENRNDHKRDCFISNYKISDLSIKHNKYSYVPDNSQYLTLNTIKRLKEDGVNFEHECNLYQDEIVSKDFYEYNSIVYDLTLENTHLFWANGFYVHNSGRRGALMLSTHIKSIDSKDFIDAKLDTKKVTGANISVKIDDEFMEALEEDKEYIQQFPLFVDNPIKTQEINPKDIWNKLVENNWQCAEPGILFWDTIKRESVPDSYSDEGFESIGTNPCVVGDTKVAVADGRGYISFKQLAEEGKDIMVYTLDNKGELCVRIMRNPRVSERNRKIYKVTIEGGHEIRVSDNHKFRLKDGSYKEAKHLKYGDSLHIMTKWEASLEDIFKNSNSRSSDYYWLNNGEFGKHKSEHRFLYEQLTGDKIDNGYVIHHKDFNSRNNSIDNLQLMSKSEHDKYHGIMMKGEKNPYHKMDEEWKFNFASHPGEKNPNVNSITNNEIIEHFKKLTIKLERRISYKDWQEYAKENKIPQTFSKWRQNELGTIMSLSKKVALELGYDNIDADPRLVKTYKEALNNGYDAEISDNKVLVTKICENCGEEFKINYFKREISFCSNECSLHYINSNKEIKEKRLNSINDIFSKKSKETKLKQIEILSRLKFKLDRIPLLKEWESECEENNVSHRLKTKYGFKNYKEICDKIETYNHKVISIQEDGYEDVYNGTVDEFHNYFSGGFEEKTKNGKIKFISLNQLNCGEIVLCDADSCRLLLLNLLGFVENPFTKDAFFNFEKFKKYVFYAQRYMDDIVDLELEQISKILDKVEEDPESEITKIYEKNLWSRIYDKCKKGRRTGTGVTGEGDMLAALNLKYGTKEASKFSEKVHQQLSLNAYKASVELAKERGAFEIFDFNKEKDNIFLNRLFKIDPQLKEDMIKYGRRNIALLTIAPAGCLTEDSKIKTDRGELTLAQLFLVNGYDLEKFRGLKNIWLDVNEEIYVENIYGEKNKITKLYWNGEAETKKIILEDGNNLESTLEHKFLVKLNDKEAIWKKANELKVGDKILQKK